MDSCVGICDVHCENLNSIPKARVSSCLVLLKAERQPEENTGHKGLEHTMLNTLSCEQSSIIPFQRVSAGDEEQLAAASSGHSYHNLVSTNYSFSVDKP